MAPVGVLAFWLGMSMARWRFPSEYDWRYMTISDLVYPHRNPAGYPWAWGGLVLCGLGGLCWAVAMARDGKREGAAGGGAGVWALGLGSICMMLALLPGPLPGVPKSHEILAVAAFLGFCGGVVQLAIREIMRQRPVRRDGPLVNPRVCAVVAVGVAAAPILLAGLAQAYVAYARPDLPWVGLAWRMRAVPIYLSFAFWEWISCLVFSVYVTSLSLLALRRSQ